MTEPAGTEGSSGGPGEPFQSLYRRFRPQRFSEVRGQDHVTRALRNSVRNGTVSHAYLFSGPRGTGKTSSARILAKALNCLDPQDGEPCDRCDSCRAVTTGSSLDVHELDAASNNGVDAMRDLVSRAALGTPGRWKVYIIDEVHMLSAAASNALLKTLEEPPGHVVFVLATTDPRKVLDTIRSRTQHFEFRLLGGETLSGLLTDVSGAAGLGLPQEALDLAVRRGHGSARDALSFLDQVAASGVVEDEAEAVDHLLEALAEGDPAAVLHAVAEACAAGRDPQRLGNDIIAQLRNGFLASMAPELVALPDDARERAAQQAGRLGTAAVVRIMEKVGSALVDMREALDPRVSLEVVLVRLARGDTDSSAEGLSERIARLERRLDSGGPVPAGTGGATTDARAAGGRAAPPGRAAPATGRPAPPASSGRDDTPVSDSAPAAPPAPPASGAAGARQALGALRNRPASSGPSSRQKSADSPTQSDRAAPPARPSPPGSEAGPAPAGPRGTANTAAAEGSGPPATTTDGGPGDGAGPTRDDVVQAWGDGILGSLPGRARARYGTGRFVAVDGTKATFAVPNEPHRRYCQECRGEVEAALSAHFGLPLSLVLVVEPEEDAQGHQPEDEIDLNELTDAPALADVSPEQRLLQAFPGSEEVG